MELSVHDLALDVRGVGSVGIRQEKCASVLRARPAPIPLLALPCRAMSHNIGALTMGAVQDLDHHDATRSCWVFRKYSITPSQEVGRIPPRQQRVGSDEAICACNAGGGFCAV